MDVAILEAHVADQPTQEWITLLQAARYLGVSPNTFREMIRNGELTSVRTYKPATRRYYNTEDLVAFRQSRITPASPSTCR